MLLSSYLMMNENFSNLSQAFNQKWPNQIFEQKKRTWDHTGHHTVITGKILENLTGATVR